MAETDEKKMELIWGAEDIAKAIGRSPRVTFHLLTTGALPAKKVGGRWVAERGKLIAFFMETAA
ncbi:DNA-binding protein [Neorhizobium galegae]|uniref:DNA-binding protein n=1 Tax=Neorhizobium galegae TaxID=399 RepID=UPI001F2AE85C|nr:DNA-binding protein [Neorhizobium galegae]UIK05034.1 DNA-binding protein [Neorhizobium galegae]